MIKNHSIQPSGYFIIRTQRLGESTFEIFVGPEKGRSQIPSESSNLL